MSALARPTRHADRELIAELRRSAEGISFDEMPMVDLSVEDLDLKAAQDAFVGVRKLDEQALLTLKLLTRHQNRLVPTKGAILLFGKERTRHFPDAWIQCGRFFGTRKLDIFDHIDLEVPLPQAVDEVILFLKKHAFRGADLYHVRRRDVWSIPLGILREVIINACVHADFSQRGAPIRIVFLDDRIEVESMGILLPGLTIEDMKQGASRIRNPVIARVFKELHLIEQWGTGVPRIFAEAQELGLPEPKIEELALRLRFTIFLGQLHHLPAPEQNPTAQVTEQATEYVSEQVKRLLAILKDQEFGSKAAMAALHLNHRPTFLYDYLKPALTDELVEMTQPKTPKSPTQKYRLTQKGKNLLQKLKP